MKEILNFEKNELMYMINYSLFVNFLQKEVSKNKLINLKKINISQKKISKIMSEKNFFIYNLILNCTGSKSILIKDKITSQLKIEILTYKENELPDKIKNVKPTKPGSRNIF